MNEATTPPLLEVRDLVIEYGDTPGAMHRALDGATLSVRAGEVLGLVGESGSGKAPWAWLWDACWRTTPAGPAAN